MASSYVNVMSLSAQPEFAKTYSNDGFLAYT